MKMRLMKFLWYKPNCNNKLYYPKIDIHNGHRSFGYIIRWHDNIIDVKYESKIENSNIFANFYKKAQFCNWNEIKSQDTIIKLKSPWLKSKLVLHHCAW